MTTARELSQLDVPAGEPAIEGAAAAADAVWFDDVSDRYRGRGLANTMSVDVEDYFQVSAFENHISRENWDSIPARLPRNIERILALFDAADIRATFFTLGWVCERHPGVIRDIVAAGHELASHGHDHARVWDLGRDRFKADVESTRKRLEDVSGVAVRGYRAPSFSVGTRSLWAYDALREAGYQYSSSVFPIQHDHYGLPQAPRFPFVVKPSDMLEVPMSSITLFGRNWPCSGGGFFRLLPYLYSRWATRRINATDGMPAMFYFHPWEIDPDQPRVGGLPLKSRFRHYVNLHRFEPRLSRLLDEFDWGRIDDVFLGSR